MLIPHVVFQQFVWLTRGTSSFIFSFRLDPDKHHKLTKEIYVLVELTAYEHMGAEKGLT